MARVIVVGAGVIGLSCAVRLLEAGHHADVLARDLPLETASAIAGAVWQAPSEPPQRHSDWAATAYRVFEEIAADPTSGVRLRRGSELLRTPRTDPPPVVRGLRRLTPPPPYAVGWSFVAPVVDMPLYLLWLVRRIEVLGGTVTRMGLSGLPDRAEVVVNATGLGARLMAGDLAVQPSRDEVLLLEQVGVEEWCLDESASTYVVPRDHDIVVGGLGAPGWSRTPSVQAARDVLRRARALVPELEGARVTSHRVGLRPERPTVRLEEDRIGGTRVVHCYGHGGGGVTLSWGCAAEVAALVDQNSRAVGSSIPRSAS